jgi:hypothetical protein
VLTTRREAAVNAGESGHLTGSSSSRLRAYKAVSAILSDDHNYERGVQAARAVLEAALVEAGPAGLTEMALELSLKLAEALEHIAAEDGITAADLAEVWFAD